MKMPDTIPLYMLAACGINCLACYRHCAARSQNQQCPGCLSDSPGKPNHCRVCKIKGCAFSKGYERCLECCDFPCKLIKNLEKSYNQRYGESLIASSLYVREHSLLEFMSAEKEKRACPDCGGVINLHDKVCSECGKDFNL